VSRETAQQFIDALENDTSLLSQFYMTSPNSMDGVVDFAYNKGYTFTQDELEKALKHTPESKAAQQLRQLVR
jgi:predicted ribosomally synthesized peptide with nif11-like leader